MRKSIIIAALLLAAPAYAEGPDLIGRQLEPEQCQIIARAVMARSKESSEHSRVADHAPLLPTLQGILDTAKACGIFHEGQRTALMGVLMTARNPSAWALREILVQHAPKP